MKKIKLLLLSVAAVGLTFFLAKCKKDPPSVVQTYTISGLCTYPNYSNVMTPAKGAVLTIYAGTDPNALATTFADSLGNYKFAGLLPGPYVIKAKYNTANTNYKPYNGINFTVNYNVTLATANMTQNVVLNTIAATTALNVSILTADTVGTNGAVKLVYNEAHSNVTFWCQQTDSQAVGLTLGGSFPALGEISNGKYFNITKFRFSEANPALSCLKAYIITSHCNTNNKGRDTIHAGCVDTFWNHDTMVNPSTGGVSIVPVTDTAWYWANPGSISKYGSGWIAHGTLAPCWKHDGLLPGMHDKWSVRKGDSLMGYTGQLGWNTRIQAPCDLYFEYQGKKITWNAAHTIFTESFEFEGELVFRRSTYYMSAGIGNILTVNPHIQFKGIANVTY